MPPSKPKPSEIAAEAKKNYIPFIKQKYPQWETTSYLIVDSAFQIPCSPQPQPQRLKLAMIEGDPVDVALDWARTQQKSGQPPPLIPIINMANDKRPGGDWEASVIAPEENLCRRSNLFATLKDGYDSQGKPSSNYPIPTKGGIYSKSVVVFRSGPEKYQVWQEFKALPVISVPPVRRPKLDATGKKYSFDAERELMKDKIRTALRIAVHYGHTDICLGAFGCGPIFRNPTREVATMFKDILFYETEFKGQFSNIVFAFDPSEASGSNSGSSGSKSGSSSSSSSKGSSKGSPAKSQMETFKDVLDPSKLYSTYE